MIAPALPPLSPRLLAGCGALAAMVVSFLMSRSVGVGVGVALAMLYAPIALLSVPVALALWLPLVFLAQLPFVWVGPTAAAGVILVAWLGTLRSRANLAVMRVHLPLIGSLALYVVWLTLSVLWADQPARAGEDLYVWYVAGLVLLVVMSSISSVGTMRIVIAAFVGGAVLSVLVGLVLTGLAPAQSALASAAQVEGRLGGGSGDPNYLAAALVPAIVLGGALIAIVRAAAVRLAVLVGIVVLVVGLAATESRGGLVAGVTAVGLSFVLFKRRRLYVGALLAVVLTVAGLWFVSSPSAFQRITSFDGGGGGRTDLWTVAWRVFVAHPIVGVGLNNFMFSEQRYVRRPGELTAVSQIVDKPHVVHNVYLQALAELGIVGLALLLGLLAFCLRATRRAMTIFDARGPPELATLSRALLIAQVAVLVALFFISDLADERFWFLFGLGPALWGIAHGGRIEKAQIESTL